MLRGEKSLSTHGSVSSKILSKNEGKIKTFSYKRKRRGFKACRPVASESEGRRGLSRLKGNDARGRETWDFMGEDRPLDMVRVWENLKDSFLLCMSSKYMTI